MEKETEDNIQAVCPECIKKMIRAFDHSKVEKGDFVKVGFDTVFHNTEQGPPVEHIWIKVTEIFENEYLGIVSNEPFWIPKLSHDDLISFLKSKVWNHIKA